MLRKFLYSRNSSAKKGTETMESSENLQNLPFEHTIELPDCIVSYIFSKLSMKDMVKTSTLSKRWLHEWGSKLDLNFDIHNMFDRDTVTRYDPSCLGWIQSEFVRRVDQFMLHYEGTKIHSLRVEFPLGDDDSNVIDTLILKGIAKGVERIELFFTSKIYFGIVLHREQRYRFSGALLSESRNSLKYLHLQKCLLLPHEDFSGFKSLTTLVLQLVVVEREMLLVMLCNCIHLVDLTLNNCEITSDLKIISTTLRNLYIVNFNSENLRWKIDIDAFNLSSFEFSGQIRVSSIKAPKLLSISWDASHHEEIPPCPFDLIATLHQLENVTMIVNYPKILTVLSRDMGPFQNLRELKFFINGAYNPNMDYLWILDIAMVSPHLQKLCLTIRHSYWRHCLGTYQRQKRDHVEFYHNELKYIELCGCVGTINEIELASQFLKNMNSLEQITFNPCDRFYIGAGRWTEGYYICHLFDRDRIREMLKDDVNEQCQLIIL